ncbi:MAG: hypothetical protein ACK5JT_15635, partial [Hyphomicrobiaceae bacterium]
LGMACLISLFSPVKGRRDGTILWASLRNSRRGGSVPDKRKNEKYGHSTNDTKSVHVPQTSFVR